MNRITSHIFIYASLLSLAVTSCDDKDAYTYTAKATLNDTIGMNHVFYVYTDSLSGEKIYRLDSSYLINSLNGQLISASSYVNGWLSGPTLVYSNNTGRLIKVVEFKQGKKNGKTLIYHSRTGRLRYDIDYVNDQKHGEVIRYNSSSGEVYKITEYYQGIKHGRCYQLLYGGGHSIKNYENGMMYGWMRTVDDTIEFYNFYGYGKRIGNTYAFDTLGNMEFHLFSDVNNNTLVDTRIQINADDVRKVKPIFVYQPLRFNPVRELDYGVILPHSPFITCRNITVKVNDTAYHIPRIDTGYIDLLALHNGHIDSAAVSCELHGDIIDQSFNISSKYITPIDSLL